MKHLKIIIAAIAIVTCDNAQADCASTVQQRFELYKALAVQMYPKVQALKKVTSEVTNSSDWYGRTLPKNHLVQIANDDCSLFWAHTDAVIAHELGHVIAYDIMSNSGEDDADRIGATLLNQQIRGELVFYMDNQCLIGKTYFCGRVARWKQIFN